MVRCHFRRTLKLSVFILFLYAALCFIISQNGYGFSDQTDTEDPFKFKDTTLGLINPANPQHIDPDTTEALPHNSEKKNGNLDQSPLLKEIRILPNRGFRYDSLVIAEDETPAIAEQKYYRLISHLDVSCDQWARVGRKTDGGWNICTAGPYNPRPPCLVYSFGIGKDFSFDDEMASTYGCTVRAFDPSMPGFSPKRRSGVFFYNRGLAEHNGWQKKGWKMHTLTQLLHNFHEDNATLDILKIDIEYSEWGALRSILKDNTLSRVKQLTFETHTKELRGGEPSTVKDFIEYSRIIYEVRSQGFRLWTSHFNEAGGYWSKRSGDHRTCCHELGFININYLKGFSIRIN